MKFMIAVLLVALVIKVNSIDAGTRNVEVPDSIVSQNFREKRSLGVSKDTKKEWELKTKSGASLRVSKSVSYNDGGALQMLPALLDSKSKKWVKILNQLQNGRGRPEVAQQMLSEATPGVDFGIDTDIESRHTRASASSDASSLTFLSHHKTATGSAAVVSDPTIVVNRIAVPRIVVQPIAGTGVCCGQSESVVPVNTGPSHLQRHVQKSIDYLRYKQEKKQAFLNELQSLKKRIAYKKVAKAQRIREKLAAIHAIKASKINKCPTCCCN